MARVRGWEHTSGNIKPYTPNLSVLNARLTLGLIHTGLIGDCSKPFVYHTSQATLKDWNSEGKADIALGPELRASLNSMTGDCNTTMVRKTLTRPHDTNLLPKASWFYRFSWRVACINVYEWWAWHGGGDSHCMHFVQWFNVQGPSHLFFLSLEKLPSRRTEEQS